MFNNHVGSHEPRPPTLKNSSFLQGGLADGTQRMPMFAKGDCATIQRIHRTRVGAQTSPLSTTAWRYTEQAIPTPLLLVESEVRQLVSFGAVEPLRRFLQAFHKLRSLLEGLARI